MCFFALWLARVNSNMESGAANSISAQMFENLNLMIWQISFYAATRFFNLIYKN